MPRAASRTNVRNSRSLNPSDFCLPCLVDRASSKACRDRDTRLAEPASPFFGVSVTKRKKKEDIKSSGKEYRIGYIEMRNPCMILSVGALSCAALFAVQCLLSRVARYLPSRVYLICHRCHAHRRNSSGHGLWLSPRNTCRFALSSIQVDFRASRASVRRGLFFNLLLVPAHESLPAFMLTPSTLTFHACLVMTTPISCCFLHSALLLFGRVQRHERCVLVAASLLCQLTCVVSMQPVIS